MVNLGIGIRIGVYVLATILVDVILIWGLFISSDATKPVWRILAGNLGYLLFANSASSSPYGSGALAAGLLALGIGIFCWFLIIAATGETITWLRKRKK